MDFQDKPQSILTFRVGPVLCCAPSLPVRSIIRPPTLTHPPGSEPAQPGIFRHDSHIVKVIDLRQKFGIDKTEQADPGNLIITIFGEESFAFWVDQILDVFDFPTEGWGTLPAAIPRGIFSRTLLLKNQIHLYVEFIKLTHISDLGYLKHYIQQLKQSEHKTIGAGLTSTDSIKADKAGFINNENPAPAASIFPATTSTEKVNNTAKKETSHLPVSTKTHADSSASSSSATKTPAAVLNPQQTPSTTIKSETFTPAAKKIAASAETKHIKNINTLRTPSVIQRAKPIIQKTQVTQTANAAKIQVSAATAPPTRSTTRLSTAAAKPGAMTESDIENESSIAGILFLLFLIAGISSIAYLFFSSAATKQISTVPVFDSEKYAMPLYPSEANTYETATVPDKTIATKNIQESIPSTVIAPAYRAEISQQENDITITIHKPKIPKADKTKNDSSMLISELDVSTSETAAGINTKTDNVAVTRIDNETDSNAILTNDVVVSSLATDKPIFEPTEVKSLNTETLKNNEVTQNLATANEIEEVIHVVVKGDTLWAIAIKYVNDPFLYPELARLSQIKNPHRIYPGNRVRIRFVKD